jgi:hypothetical protein
MTKKLKHIISISLVFVFLTPMTVKLLDSRFHHHYHFICTAKNEHHFHEYHDKCSIPGFEFFLYTLNKIVLETQKTFYFEKLLINYFSIRCCSESKYSFSLRAPPFNIHN